MIVPNRKSVHIYNLHSNDFLSPEIQRDSEDPAAARGPQRKLRDSRRIDVHASALSSREDGRRSSVDRDRLL